MEKIFVRIVNNVFFVLKTEMHQDRELSDYFSCYVKDYKFMPKYRNGVWDGKVRFYNLRDRTLPIGLLPELLKFCSRYDYELVPEYDQNILLPKTYHECQYQEFLSSIPLSTKYKPRDYQEEAFKKLVTASRGVAQVSTGLGKSLIIYMLTNYVQRQSKKVLIIVPSITLVNQLYDDFKNYGFGDSVSERVTKVYSGSKDKWRDIVISTWQSMFRKDDLFFEQFNALIIDETHLLSLSSQKTEKRNGIKVSTGASIKKIAEKCKNAEYRWGLTGTLSEDKCDMWTLRGYLGEVVMNTVSSEYIEKGILSQMKVVNLFGKYPEQICKELRKAKIAYNDEVDFSLDYSGRNSMLDFVMKCSKPEDNTLILVTKIEKQLKPLEIYIKEKYNKKLYIIYGDTNGEERERIRKEVEGSNGCVLLASYGTLSTGVNIRKIHNVVFYSSYKSKIKVLQSIGRGLRTHEDKKMLIVWDCIDDMRVGKYKNALFKHWEERVRYYNEQGFKTINKVLEI